MNLSFSCADSGLDSLSHDDSSSSPESALGLATRGEVSAGTAVDDEGRAVAVSSRTTVSLECELIDPFSDPILLTSQFAPLLPDSPWVVAWTPTLDWEVEEDEIWTEEEVTSLDVCAVGITIIRLVSGILGSSDLRSTEGCSWEADGGVGVGSSDRLEDYSEAAVILRDFLSLAIDE